MTRVLEDKVAIVTGSGQGIGREIARCMAAQGCRIVTNNRARGSSIHAFEKTEIAFCEEERKELEKMQGDAQTSADEIVRAGGIAAPFFGDVSDFTTAREMVRFAVETYGRLDIVVHNASSNWEGSFLDMDETLWDRSISSKLKGAFNLMHHALPQMLEQKYGRILLSSSDAFLGLHGLAAYSAANAGVVALTRSVAKEMENTGITVNAYTPLARTRAWYNQAANYRRRGVPKAVLEANIPEAMKYGAEGMVPFLAYLASEKAAQITGELFKLAADGEIGLWGEAGVICSIREPDRIWTMEELERRVPGELLAFTKQGQSVIEG
ncbi:MAG: SDR family NAD(P)-dependent oxidoreductase [Eubacteriales bacterium]|nr:SDR family NAD(P)-dependent oxidoreductase [Eubacteriales bacterium]